MPYLHNKSITGLFTMNGVASYGAYESIDEDTVLFATSVHEYPRWLGNKPRALFGVVQHLESWTTEWTEEATRIKDAYIRLLERNHDSLIGQMFLRPLENLPSDFGNPIRPAEVLYQYISLSMIEQYSDQHQWAAETIERNFSELINEQSELICLPFVSGANFEFGFAFKDQKLANQFRVALYCAGIFNKPLHDSRVLPGRWPENTAAENAAGNPPNSCRFLFQLNLAYREREMDLFWEQLRLAFGQFRNDDAVWGSKEVQLKREFREPLYRFHQGLMKAKTTKKVPGDCEPTELLQTHFQSGSLELEPVVLTKELYPEYRDQILAMQTTVYEPARRTPPEEFDMLFDSDLPLAIIVLDGKNRENNSGTKRSDPAAIVAMAFAGQLGLFTQERGVSTDPFVNDPTVYYSMDLTALPEYRGGTGRTMKQAMVMLAIKNGVTAIHGRNRDRLAAGMWAINLSLGSYELQRLVDDYPDDQPYRDCIYYRCPLTWNGAKEEHLRKMDLSGMLDGSALKDNSIRIDD